MKKGDKIICMPGIDYRLDFQEGYYLEETASKNGSFLITTKEEIINTYSGTTDETFSDGVYFVDDYDYIKPYTPENFDKLFNRYVFLNNRSYIYYLFFKWYAINYDFQYFYDTELYRKLIKNFTFVRIRFILELIRLGLLGLLKRIVYFFCFFIDIMKHLFDAYFEYKASIHSLQKEIYGSKSLIIRSSLSHEQIQNGIKEKENQVLIAKEKYFKINTTFMTLIISLIAIFCTVVLNKIESINLSNKITYLEQKNIEMQLSWEQHNQALLSIIDEKDLEIKKLQQIEAELQLKQLEAKLLEIENELGSKLLSVSELIKSVQEYYGENNDRK